MSDKVLPTDDLVYRVNGLAMKVHRILGRGFHESIYKDALEHEFQQAGIPYERERCYKVPYCDIVLRNKYKADFVVQNDILLEVKARRLVIEDHLLQTLNYLAVSRLPLAIIYNFGEKSLFIKRCAVAAFIPGSGIDLTLLATKRNSNNLDRAKSALIRGNPCLAGRRRG